MKKSLTVVLSTAMALSMFSSVAFGKTSADFSDLSGLDAATKAKFDAMIEAGIFDGVAEGKFGLTDKMNRAQFAKVAALIFDLEVDADLKTSSFTDVDADDAANGYALPYIEAVKKAGITDGYGEGIYNPAGEVTKEQLAAFLIRGLGFDAEAQATPGVSDKTVSDWAKSYVAFAIEKKVVENGADGTFGGTSAATRELLVIAAHAANEAYVPPVGSALVVTGVKATDAKELTVSFNGGLTEVKAENFEVKRDNGVAAIDTVKVGEDKKSAVITLKDKLVEATYTVTAKDLDKLDATKASAEVKAEAEKITKIDFVTASETIAQAKDIMIEFQAVNQYGKKAVKNATDVEIRISDRDVEGTVSTISGKSAFYIDTYISDRDANPSNTNLSDRNNLRVGDRISISLYDSDSRVQTQKVFTVGDEQNVTKIELGDLVDKNGNKQDYIRTVQLDTGYLKYTAFDQYGFKVSNLAKLNDSVRISSSDRDLEAATVTAGVLDTKNPFIADQSGDDLPELQLVYNQTDSSRRVTKDITITAFASGSTATKVVNVAAIKQPASIEIPAYTKTLADGDTEKVIPIVVKDSAGTALTAQEIRDAAIDGKFRTYTTGYVREIGNRVANGTVPSVVDGIITSGDDIGKLIVDARGTGSSKIEIALREKPEVKGTLNISVSKKRYPDTIKVSSALTPTIVKGGKDSFKIKTYDQYGEEYKKNLTGDAYRLRVTLTDVGKDGQVKLDSIHNGGLNSVTSLDSSVANAVYETYEWANNTDAKIYDEEMFLDATGLNSKVGTYKLTFEYLKQDGATWKLVGNALNQTVQVINGTEANKTLTYSISLDKYNADNGVVAAKDLVANGYTLYKDTLDGSGNVIATNPFTTDSATTPIPVNSADLYANYAMFGKEIKVAAKDQNNNDVGVDGFSTVVDVTSDNTGVADAVYSGGKFFVVGLKQGTANLVVKFKTPTGTQTANVVVKTTNAAPSVASIVFDKKTRTHVFANIGTKTVWDNDLGNKITVKDQFGNEYTLDQGQTISGRDVNILNLQFSVTDIKWKSSVADADKIQNAIEVDNTTGQLTFNGNAANDVSSFRVVVTAPSGQSATLDIVQ